MLPPSIVNHFELLTCGVFNHFLHLAHLPRVKWLTDTTTALFSVSLVSVWLQLGLNTIILLAGMQDIPEELYEAARIDGAGYWQSLRNVTLPLLSPTIFFLIVVDTLAAFQAFTQFNVLTKGGPVQATNTLVYSIFREFYFNGNYGYASAMAVVLLLIMLVFTVLQFGVLERRVHYQMKLQHTPGALSGPSSSTSCSSQLRHGAVSAVLCRGHLGGRGQ